MLSEGLQNELAAFLDELEKDDDIGLAILTGAPRPDGRPCFSTDGDIKEMQGKGSFSERLLGSLEEGHSRRWQRPRHWSGYRPDLC